MERLQAQPVNLTGIQKQTSRDTTKISPSSRIDGKVMMNIRRELSARKRLWKENLSKLTVIDLTIFVNVGQLEGLINLEQMIQNINKEENEPDEFYFLTSS